MNPLILQPIRWHFSLAALLALACACAAGAWLATASTAKKSGPVLLSHRSMPPHFMGLDTDTQVQEQKASLLREKEQTETQLETTQGAWKDLQARVTAAQQQAMTLSNDNGPEKQAVLKLREQQPRWALLDLAPADAAVLADVWDSKSTQVDRALDILETSGKKWKKQGATAVATGTTERQKRQFALADLKTSFDKASANALIILNVDDLVPDKTSPLLTDIRKIIESIGTSRAIAGATFTNSAGMEMVWIPDGGFWIGKSEVTTAAYKAVKGANGGDDSPAEGISFPEAIDFCIALNKLEAEDKAILPPGQKLRPTNAEYTLPTVKQWRLGRAEEESLNMKGFSNGLSEWSQDKQSSGLATESILGGASSLWYLALNGGSAVALPPSTSGSIMQTGPGTKATGKGGTITIWSGRLGLRVILVPKQE